MRIAYLDCASGISGDMTLGALVDAGADLAAIQAGIDSLGPAKLPARRQRSEKAGLPRHANHDRTRARAQASPPAPHHGDDRRQHAHCPAEGIGETHLPANWPRPRRKFTASTIEKVHFHEVGAVDSIADIVGSAIGFDLFGIERIVCSPVPTGHGFVEIAHGRCSIPAPATGELLRGVPLAALDVEGELTTPTGAAIVAALADDFGPLPAMTVDQHRLRRGPKRFPASQHPAPARRRGRFSDRVAYSSDRTMHQRPHTESIVVLETNLDNATGETIGHAVDRCGPPARSTSRSRRSR